MSELHDLLERRAADYEPPADLLPRVRERRRQRERNRRVGTALAGVLVLAVAVSGLTRVVQPTREVFFDQTSSAWSGTWVSTDTDGSFQTMEIRGLKGGTYEVRVADDAATVCAGVPSTMTGIGHFDDTGLVITKPKLTCDDGSTPEMTDGSSLAKALRNYTLVHDAETDTLTDNLGVDWWRPAATPDADSTELPMSGVMWPQSSIDEVREAQERADAGDAAYTWQVEPAMGDVGGDAEIFARFLTEELGWEGFRWGAEANHSQSMHWRGSDDSAEIDFVRCAEGELNALYPDDSEGRGCAPTLDDNKYETVRVAAYQPLGASPDGIWVVRGSQRQPAFRQAVPLSDAEIARAVEPFLQARVDGKGAGGYGPAKIPLLYATSDGARYERFDYEVVKGPIWPFGMVHVNVRLFADGGETLVEQPFRLELDLSSVVTPQPPHRLTMLEYAPGEKPSTENGAPVPEPHSLFGGRVTFAAGQSWEGVFMGPHGPDVIGLYRSNEHDELFVVVGDPLTPTETCDVGDQPSSADALVRSVRSRPNLTVSAPRPTRVGSIEAVQLDVTAGDQGGGCEVPPDVFEQPEEGPAVLAPRSDQNHPEQRLWWGVGDDNRARLYVFDVPGNPERTVAILILAPKSTFEDVLEEAQPILDSFEITAK